MVKLRDAGYCNLKLLLIFLVIYGHLIEPQIYDKPLLMEQYRWIYMVHMPLFAFLSGLFAQSGDACLGQLKKCFSLYIFMQTAAVFLGDGAVKPLTPYWHLWYLLSVSFWSGLGWLWFRFGRGKLTILACGILLGCAVGYIPNVGRVHSLSRTLVFFPYFFAGLICDRSFRWEKHRWTAVAVLGIAICVMLTYGKRISPVFLYQAAAYGNSTDGFVKRLVCYGAGFGLGLFLLAFMPRWRMPFTKAGADTMTAYLAHVPFVLPVRQWELPWLWYLPITVAFLYAVYKITQWHRSMYGIANSNLSLCHFGAQRLPPGGKLSKNRLFATDFLTDEGSSNV